MALSYVDTDGTLVIPGAAAKWETAPSNSGISTTGVVVLVGEAESGPDYSVDDLASIAFGPRQFGAVAAKYGSGPLVDAFKVVANPSRDPGIRGAPSRIYTVKTNGGTAATYAFASSYATVRAKLPGALGNLISIQATSAGTGRVKLDVTRRFDSVQESWTVGNDIVLSLGAQTADAVSVTISAAGVLTAPAGTGTAALNIALRDFKTVNDLASFIAAQNGWTAAATPAFGQMKPTSLDTGAYVANTTTPGATPAQVKKDAYDFVKALTSSRVIEVSVKPTAGLPAAMARASYLSGGAKGGTTEADVLAALDKAGLAKANFVVPLFSRDATDDITDGLTDATSTYTIASVNSGLSAHVSKFSQFKRQRPRQGFGSYRGTLANSKLAAQNIANPRVSMNFLDVAALGAAGTAWFQPWMGAVVAAGMQAAGFYRPMFNKGLGISGVRHAGGEFDPADDDAVEQALLSGLMVIRERDGGGFAFASDNTTYGADESFVYNSIQAVYVADTIAMTTKQRMERAFVGQSFADLNSAVAMSFFKGVMADLRRLRLITTSDDAVEGYKDALIEIRPPAMLVSAEVKEATGCYFVPIKFLVTQVSQTAQG